MKIFFTNFKHILWLLIKWIKIICIIRYSKKDLTLNLRREITLFMLMDKMDKKLSTLSVVRKWYYNLSS